MFRLAWNVYVRELGVYEFGLGIEHPLGRARGRRVVSFRGNWSVVRSENTLPILSNVSAPISTGLVKSGLDKVTELVIPRTCLELKSRSDKSSKFGF